MIRLNPLALKQLQRFRSIKRGYYSALVLVALILLGAFAELLVSNRAVAVRFDGEWFFPTYTVFLAGRTFELDYDYETEPSGEAENYDLAILIGFGLEF